MGYYRVKPGIIEARQMPKTNDARKTKTAMAIYEWIKEHGFEYECYNVAGFQYISRTHKLEGGLCGVTIDDYGRIMILTSWNELEVLPESWVIRYGNGQFSTMSDSDFQDNYEWVGNSTQTFETQMNSSTPKQ